MEGQSANIAQFRFYCQKVLPAVYDDSLSYYEVLCKVQEKLNEVITVVNGGEYGIEELQAAVMALEKEFQAFKESGFDDYYKAQVEKWINDNLRYIYDNVIRQVFFGLTDTGYFCAYVPDSWDDIMFDTGAVYNTAEYGRLILRYRVDGQGVIDNTGQALSIAQLQEQVNQNTRNIGTNSATLYTPVINS